MPRSRWFSARQRADRSSAGGTGHSLGEAVHGNGVNMDDYETHDDRRLLVGTGFTIEPGVYFEDFGVRSEINMIVGPRDAGVTGPVQKEIVVLA
jgi:Xaa-Pro dipeptidase